MELDPWQLDPSQQRVLALAVDESAVVVGAPGTGKTATLVEFVADRVERLGVEPDALLAIGATRATATALRDRLALRLGRVTSGPLARTASSAAFEIVAARAAAEGAPPPRLLSGADQDSILRELLDGHRTDGRGPAWPHPLDEQVRALPAFRGELRELIGRVEEFGVTPARLAELGARHGRPDWSAAAELIAEYREILALSRGSSLDPAELMAFAERAIHDGQLGERLSRLRVVVVDDLQQATEGTLRMLAALAARGVAVVGFGDPDLAVNSFRGGEAYALSALGERLGIAGIPTLTLDRVHRSGARIREAVVSVADRIGAAGEGRQRAARAAASNSVPDDSVTVVTEASPAALSAAIARQLRERHLLDGVEWHRMAVITRSGAAIPSLARALALAQVPTRTLVGGRALREDPAAGALLRLVSVGSGRDALDADSAREVLLGAFGGLDPVGLRRLRMALRAEELVGGGTRLGPELLADALASPGRFATIDHALARRAERLAGVLADLRELSASGATAEELLWSAWNGSGVAEAWKQRALGTGIGAEEANRALDGVLALFSAARRWVERSPERGAAAFLDEVLDAEVPEDSLAPRTNDDAVLISTASGAIGTEFDTVVVTGLQEGAWPNLRPRGSLLGTARLLDVVAGRTSTAHDESRALDDRRAVLSDELRALALAVSRAQSRLVVAAIASEDEAPSAFFRLLAGGIEPVTGDAPPLTLRGYVGRIRRTLTASSSGTQRRAEAASALARLAAEEVSGADPGDWHGLAGASTTAPVYDLSDAEARVPVSPSQLTNIERSPLEWFVQAMAGGASSTTAGMGTLVHDALERSVSGDADELWSLLQERWGELEFESEWVAVQQSRAARRAITALADYLADFAGAGAVLVSAEGAFHLDLAPAMLNGKIDRVEAYGDRVVIVDLKTGRVEDARGAAEHPQLGAYQLAYAAGELEGLPPGHVAGGAKLLFTKKGTSTTSYVVREQTAFGPDELERFRDRVREAAVAMAGPSYAAVEIDDQWAPGGAIRRVHLPTEVSSD